jgi:hypothetical protein
MMAFERMPEYRFYSLPVIYNFRRPAIYGSTFPSNPVIIQSKIFQDPRASVDHYKDVALHAAVVMFEDCLANMKKVIFGCWL